MSYHKSDETFFSLFVAERIINEVGVSYHRKERYEAGLLNKSSFLAPALGVTKFIFVTDMIGSGFVVPLKLDLDV
jgi:hypothetical protein